MGAGVAGASCAGVLGRAGWDVVLFDAGRRVGGRASSRVWDGDLKVVFDHGVGVFHGVGDVEKKCVRRGVVEGWKARRVGLGKGGKVMSKGEEDVWLGVPRQSCLVESLMEGGGRELRSKVKVGGLERVGGGWRLMDEEEGDLGKYDAAVLATHPAAVGRMKAPKEVVDLVRNVKAAPQWTIMAVLDGPTPVEWDIADVEERSGMDVSKIIVESNKPMRVSTPVRIVAYSTHAFAAQNLETPRESVATLMTAQLETLLERKVTTSVAHRWSKAISITSATPSAMFYLDTDTLIGVAGDYFGPSPGKVHTAIDSGYQLASHLLDLKSQHLNNKL